MKRILAFILAAFMLFAISACGSDETSPKKDNAPAEEETEITTPGYEDNTPPTSDSSNKTEPEVPAEPDDKPAEPDEKPAEPDEKPAEPADKPADAPAKPEDKPADKPADVPAKPEEKPADKPADVPAKPEEKPADKPADAPVKPEEKPAEKPSSTVGDALAADFRANSGKSGTEIAEIVIKNSAIPSDLMLMTMEVEPGYLTGFDNTEITGFENGVMFAPGMGTIPFVGYVFTLPSAATVDAFANILKSSANLRWNICTEAEQMIVEKSGNKVFFLMCPKSFEQ